ncbi:MAG: hypothetical protein HN390_01510 [Anaerolineae bacterium]|jgi:hypothetical protein|nr:hypothetical protein [Anaerolineae bacterium]MBT7192132.1 hypothetical protein [Anaerolineae bacterium]
MTFINAKQVQDASVPAQPSGRPGEKSYLLQREAGVWVISLQSIAVMVVVFGAAFLIGLKKDWRDDLWINAAIWAWLSGGLYFGYSLWRWSKLAWFENLFGVNLDKNPDVGNGKRPTMYIKIQYPDGSVRSADTGVPEKGRRYLMQIAQAYLNGRPISQRAMKRAYGMSRPNHEKVLAGYVKAGVLVKENPGLSNSEYVLAEPKDINTLVLQAVVNGDFEMLDDVWSSRNN